MKRVSRGELKKIFKKVKHLRLPEDLDEKDFGKLKYLGWIDETNRVAYMVYEFKGKLEGIRWEMLRLSHKPLHKGFCEVCKKHRRKGDILLVTSETRRLPKGINYRTRGNYVCSDFDRCNRDMKDEEGIRKLFQLIIEKE